ncbi:UNVERIFIED_CONTAM: hypothetical protein Sindi_1787400 [Sesamum indicum]
MSLKSVRGFLKGAPSRASFLFSPRLSFLKFGRPPCLIYLVARARKASNFEIKFLARDLKKSQSRSPCEKALAELHLLKLPTTSKLVQEKRPEILEASYYSSGQLGEPLLCCPGEGGDGNTAFDSIHVPAKKSCILKTQEVLFRVSRPIIFSKLGYGQFAGSSSAITASGHPAARLLELLLSSVTHPRGPFEGIPVELAIAWELPR